jgi:GxxExxY protein
LEKLGLIIKQQEPLKVYYEGHCVGEYFPDLWIENQLIIEIKAILTLSKEHEVKLVHYLTSTGINDGLLINFGPSVQVKRKFREYTPRGSLLNNLLHGN